MGGKCLLVYLASNVDVMHFIIFQRLICCYENSLILADFFFLEMVHRSLATFLTRTSSIKAYSVSHRRSQQCITHTHVLTQILKLNH